MVESILSWFTNTWFANLGFEWPLTLLFLPLPLLVFLWKYLSSDTGINRAMPVSPRLGDALQKIENRQTVNQWLPLCLLVIAWVGLLLAIAQPTVPDSRQLSAASGRALALAIDLSGSMEREDFQLDGLQSDRLTVVKKVAGDFLQKRAGDRVTLILYGDEAFQASPLTFDLPSLSQLLASSDIGMAGRSTAIGDALGMSIQALRNDPAPGKAIVLLSDGTNNSGSVEPESAAELASQLGIRIHTIALGSYDDPQKATGFKTAASADLDEDTLKSIAELSSGQFFRAASSQQLTDIYNEIDTLEGADSRPPPLVMRVDMRNYPLLLSLVCILWLVGTKLSAAKRASSRKLADEPAKAKHA